MRLLVTLLVNSEVEWERPRLDVISFNQISEEDNANLVAPFSEVEVKEAVWDCEGNKSPSPDGFNFTFIKIFGTP